LTCFCACSTEIDLTHYYSSFYPNSTYPRMPTYEMAWSNQGKKDVTFVVSGHQCSLDFGNLWVAILQSLLAKTTWRILVGWRGDRIPVVEICTHQPYVDITSCGDASFIWRPLWWVLSTSLVFDKHVSLSTLALEELHELIWLSISFIFFFDSISLSSSPSIHTFTMASQNS
jgi:hypothetical protein